MNLYPPALFALAFVLLPACGGSVVTNDTTQTDGGSDTMSDATPDADSFPCGPETCRATEYCIVYVCPPTLECIDLPDDGTCPAEFTKAMIPSECKLGTCSGDSCCQPINSPNSCPLPAPECSGDPGDACDFEKRTCVRYFDLY